MLLEKCDGDRLVETDGRAHSQASHRKQRTRRSSRRRGPVGEPTASVRPSKPHTRVSQVRCDSGAVLVNVRVGPARGVGSTPGLSARCQQPRRCRFNMEVPRATPSATTRDCSCRRVRHTRQQTESRRRRNQTAQRLRSRTRHATPRYSDVKGHARVCCDSCAGSQQTACSVVPSAPLCPDGPVRNQACCGAARADRVTESAAHRSGPQRAGLPKSLPRQAGPAVQR